MTRLTPYDSSINTRLREMWSCICKLQTEIGDIIGAEVVAANPTNTVGLAAKPGVLASYMRSDGAPAIDQTINPTWTGIHTFGANPIIKNVLPSLEWQLADNTNLGFINFGDGVANVPSFISAVVSDQLRFTVGVAAAATLTLGNAGQIGLGNPVAFGTAGQVLTSGGPTGAPTWATPSAGVAAANPTASLGLATINGVATTFMRSDAAPALSQAIVPTWTGIHTFSAPSSNTVSQVTLTGATPQFELTSSLAAANTKRWIAFSGSTAYVLSTASDDGLTLSDVHRVIRTGTVVQSQAFNTNGAARLTIDVNGTTTLPTVAAMNATSGATLSLKSTAPVMEWWNPAASADQRRWIMVTQSTNQFQLRTANDDGSQASGGIAMQVFRNGGTVQDVQLFVVSGTPRIKVTATATTILGMNAVPVTQATSVALTATQSGSIFSNTGAAASITYTLPAAAVGLQYEFINVLTTAATDTIVVRAVGADVIKNGTNVSPAAGQVTGDAENVNCKLVCLTAGVWTVFDDQGGVWAPGA